MRFHIPVDKTGDTANLLLTMRENFKAAVAEALRELLESKHLFQSVHVKTEHLLKEIPKKKRISKTLPPNARMLVSMFSEMPRTNARLDNTFLKLDFYQPWHLSGSATTTLTDAHAHLVMLPKIRIPCGHCSAVKPPHLPSTEGNPIAPLYETKAPGEKLTQVFAIPYQCQNCESEPVIFFVRRVGLKVMLLGRSLFEPTAVPPCIPKPVAGFYAEAVIAFKTNHCLGAFFYLRTVIEQHMRRVVKPAGRIPGEELADDYQKHLPQDFPKRFKTFKKLYQDLSVAMHEAREDDELFVVSLAEIEKHFDAARLFAIQ